MFLKSYFPYDGQNSARIRKNNGKDNKFEYNRNHSQLLPFGDATVP
jgi:hypothetical protein